MTASWRTTPSSNRRWVFLPPPPFDLEVEEEAVNEFLQKHPKIVHLQTSAKNREGIEVAFEKIALASVENKQEEM